MFLASWGGAKRHVTFGWKLPNAQRASRLILAIPLLPSIDGSRAKRCAATATDSRLRASPTNAGGPLANLETSPWNFFAAAHEVFNKITSVFAI